MATCPAVWSATLGLDDCKLLLAKPLSADVADWKAQPEAKALRGDQKAMMLMAVEANNRLVCLDEKITGNSE
jgi:hypothetical protein